jgi:hypothetical protein
MSSTCESKKNLHYSVTLINQSDYDVYLCMPSTSFYGEYIDDVKYLKCNLNRFYILEKNSTEEYQPFNYSIERELGSSQVLDWYFVSSKHYNAPLVFYDCDSISIKNDILAHYQLALEDLRQMNWTVVYPPSEEMKNMKMYAPYEK